MFTSSVDRRGRTVTHCLTSSRATVTPYPTCCGSRRIRTCLARRLRFYRPAQLSNAGALPCGRGWDRTITCRASTGRSTRELLFHSLAHPDSNRDLPLKRRVVFHTTSRPLCGADGDRTRAFRETTGNCTAQLRHRGGKGRDRTSNPLLNKQPLFH